jgi:hypothetical protein
MWILNQGLAEKEDEEVEEGVSLTRESRFAPLK